jgi:hypothetical protein
LSNNDYGPAALYGLSLLPVAGAGIKIVKTGGKGIVKGVIKGVDAVSTGAQTIKAVDVTSTGAKITVNIVDGMKVTTNQALDMTTEFLGNGYKEISPGVFRSNDGLRQVRMTTNDLTDPVGAHINFETGVTKTTFTGRESFERITNTHVFITD